MWRVTLLSDDDNTYEYFVTELSEVTILLSLITYIDTIECVKVEYNEDLMISEE